MEYSNHISPHGAVEGFYEARRQLKYHGGAIRPSHFTGYYSQTRPRSDGMIAALSMLLDCCKLGLWSKIAISHEVQWPCDFMRPHENVH